MSLCVATITPNTTTIAAAAATAAAAAAAAAAAISVIETCVSLCVAHIAYHC